MEMLCFRKQYKKCEICRNICEKLDLKLKNYIELEVVLTCNNQYKVIATKNDRPEQSR